jgi:alpha-mannosidase mngB
MTEKKIKIIPHTHWDKEWYFTSARSLVYSLKDFDEVLDTLDADPDFKCFHLDGQLSIAEEYLELHPEREEQFARLVKEGRLIIGPWYTQPDTLVVSGESLLKNLEIGIKLAEKYGGHQSIGYLPDSFGMSSQMPQIYHHMGLKYAFFRRGIAKHLVDNREFMWESPDGTKMFTHNLHHYGNMAYPPNGKEKVKAYYQEMIDKLGDSSLSDTVLLYNGEDQKPIRKNLPELVRIGNESGEYSVEIDTLENALASIQQEYLEKELPLPTYNGEFTFGQFSRTHKSIFSTRVDLKQLNNHLENYLSNIVEPLSVLASDAGSKYESILIDNIWKLMLLNSAHDSIGNCNSDWTNEDIKARYVKAKSLAEELVEFKMREIGQQVKQLDFTQFQVYNLLPNERSGFIDIELYTPYKQFTILDANGVESKFIVNRVDEVTDSYLKKSIKEIGVNNELEADWPDKINRLYRVQITLCAEKLPSMGYQTYYFREIGDE